MGKHAVVVENRSAYTNEQPFADYINRAFLPILGKVPTNPSLVSRLALPLINNCKAHMGDVVQKVLADYGMMMMTYAPHTTDVFQILDISPFGVFKLIKSNADESGMVHEVTNHVVKITCAIQRSCSPPNRQRAFQKAGFESTSVSGGQQGVTGTGRRREGYGKKKEDGDGKEKEKSCTRFRGPPLRLAKSFHLGTTGARDTRATSASQILIR
jgi:hypothetical protein